MKLKKFLSPILFGLFIMAIYLTISTKTVYASSNALTLNPGESAEFTNNTSDMMEVDNGYWQYGYYYKIDVAVYGPDNTLRDERMDASKYTFIGIMSGDRAIITNKGDEPILLDAITKRFGEKSDGSFGVIISDADFSCHKVNEKALNIVKVAVGDSFEYKNTASAKMMLYISNNCTIDYYYNNSTNPSSASGSGSFSTTLDLNERMVVKNTGTNDLYVFGGSELFNPSSNVNTQKFIDDQIVDTDKTWTLKFTGDVNFNDMTKQGITITNSKGVSVDVGMKLGEDNKTIVLTAPQDGYIPGENYTLTIGTKVHSSKGNALKKEYQLHFSIKASSV
ncbi:Ig-like domain-containing protein [Clostridium muellerianum]|nr:Ig-like domain-containing protein [Clostridium muellerianum]